MLFIVIGVVYLVYWLTALRHYEKTMVPMWQVTRHRFPEVLTEIMVLTVAAFIALSVLLIWQLTDDHPVVELSLFKSRNVTIDCLSISLAFMLYFGSIVLLPQLLQHRDLGRAGIGACRRAAGAPVTDYRTVRA